MSAGNYMYKFNLRFFIKYSLFTLLFRSFGCLYDAEEDRMPGSLIGLGLFSTCMYVRARNFMYKIECRNYSVRDVSTSVVTRKINEQKDTQFNRNP